MNANLVRQIRSLQRWESGTIRLLGLIELLLAFALLVNTIFATAVGEESMYFWIPLPIVGGLGIFQTLFFSSKAKMSSAIGILLIAEMWAISFVVSAIPFAIYGMPLVDSFFEGISGFTTTGATIVADLNVLPDSLLLWRGIIQWTGGITVLISFSFLLPMIGMGGAGLNSNEFAGSDNDNYSLKVTAASLNFLKVYCLLTVLEAVALWCCQVSAFDSVCISLSNIPTGGLLPRNESMGCYSIYAQAVTLVFMVLGATNFYMMFRAMFKKDPAIFRSKETKIMIEWFLFCAILIFINFLSELSAHGSSLNMDDVGNTAWNAVFCAIASGTGTGFGISDYSIFPTFALFILFVVEFMGGAAGSTAGGIKIYRMMALKSYITSGLSKVLHPNAVTSIRSDGKEMNEEAVTSAISTIFLFLIGLFIGLALIMLFDSQLSLQEMFGTTIAAISNAGIGPLANYADISMFSKIVMCFLMWLGRMEMVLVIILFTRGFWNDVFLSLGQYRTRAARFLFNDEKKY